MAFLGQDLRVALRRLARSKSYTAVTIVTLGLTVGVNTAFFSYLKAVTWGDFPYTDSAELLYIGHQWTASSPALSAVSAPNYLSIEEGLAELADVGVALARVFSVQESAGAEPIEGMRVTASMFELLGRGPALGRIFTAEASSDRTMVVSHRWWQERFGASPGVLGAKLSVNGEPYTIIGVMPADFFILYENPRFWIPMVFSEREKLQAFHPIGDVVARPKNGVAPARINARLDGVANDIVDRYAPLRFFFEEQGFQLRAQPLREKWQGDFRAFQRRLFLFQAAAGFVLLLGCLNMAQLMMARTKARQKELAIQQAIGGGLRVAARSVLTENVLVFVLGGFAAIGVAPLVLRALELMDFGQSPFGAPIGLDGELFAYALAVSALCGLIFGSMPAFAVMRLDLKQIIVDSSEGMSPRRGGLAGSVIVVLEFALAFVLVASALLVLRSFDELAEEEKGFEPDGVITARVTLPDPPYSDWVNRRDFVKRTLDNFREIPEIEEAATVSTLPYADRRQSVIHSIDGVDRYRGGKNPNSRVYVVSAGYFELMGIPLLRGRLFSETDLLESQRVAVVDQRFVERELDGGDPIGKRIMPGMARAWPSHLRERIPWYQIIGVVADVQHGNPSNLETYDVISAGIPAPVDAGSMYFSMEQTPSFEDAGSLTFVLKRRGRGEGIPPPMWETMAILDPNLALRNVAPLSEHVRRSWRTQETQQFLLRLFAGLAVMLSSVGVLGVMTSRTLSQRKEFALRLTLGETRGQIASRVVRRSLRLISIGLGVGILGTFPWIGFVQSVHPHVSPGSPLVYVYVALFLTALGVLSCLVPAIRSARVEPIRVLKA